jgi:hypothetical protein
MSFGKTKSLADIIADVKTQKKAEFENNEKEINSWYNRKFFDRRGGESKWDWETFSFERYLDTEKEAKFFARQRERRRTLYYQQERDYQALNQLAGVENVEAGIASKVKEIESRHRQERKQLYNLLNQECADFGIWTFDYGSLSNDAALIGKTARMHKFAFLCLKYGFLLLAIKIFLLYINLSYYGYWLPLAVMGAGLVLYLASGTNWPKYSLFLGAFILVIFKTGPGFDIFHVPFKTWLWMVGMVVAGHWIGSFKNRL